MQANNKILVISTFSFIGTIIFGFVAFPGIVNFVVRDQTALKKRNLMKKFYLKVPIPLTFSVYLFNVSNPKEVTQGQKPILNQIGPYCYTAYKEKIEVVENEGEDSLSYTPYETYFFDPIKSAPLRDDDYVTVLHPLLMGVLHIVQRDLEKLMPVVVRAMKWVFGNPKNIYLRVKVDDLLFKGLIINCTYPDFSVTALCNQIKAQLKGIVEISKNMYSFAFLSIRNGTIPMRFKILRGIKKSHELGRLVEIDHKKAQDVWSTKKCNRFQGTDGWIFPPLIKKGEGVKAFSADLCRAIGLQYIEDMKVHGLHVEKYYADLGDMSRPEEKCYCRTPKTCMPKGVLDLSDCMKLPIVATLPHFLRVDKQIADKVEGLKPVTEKHIVRILMQPMLAVPLEAQKRMQFNMFIKPDARIDFMKSIPNLLHPIFWIEEEIVLEGTLLTLIKSIFIGLRVFDVLKFVLLGVSGIGLGIGGALYLKNRKSVLITPVHQQKGQSETNTIDNNKTEIILEDAPVEVDDKHIIEEQEEKKDEFDRY